ncbi:hypothetical protein FOZ61_008767 [Perkinsus olseni]|uniref:Uncharacterized protein n=1 Tax=Perkinsus olseni TaxID=32597 RepID=A0A7J6MXQ8_PEROL|nr:hypothetical protein FOZ61_008767 [Perkinsus olseni]KAF4676216.1 hypothetical protein FOL46_006226 [Perkinsus olseni]
MTETCQVGAHVRCVVDPASGERRRGTVAWVDTEDCDIILDDDTEVNNIPLDAVRPLEDFENGTAAKEDLESCDVTTMAETVKSWANSLFKLKDFEAATEWYERGLEEIQRRLRDATKGCFCVYSSGGQARVARVSNRKNHAGPVLEEKLLIDEKTSSASESVEGAVVTVRDSSKLLMFMPGNEGLTQAQCAMLLNTARSRLSRKRLTSTEVSVAIALLTRCVYLATAWGVLERASSELATAMRDKALFWRAKAQARRSKYAAAHHDLRSMINPSPEVQRLERELRREKAEDRRSTNKIVKELCKLIPEDTNFMCSARSRVASRMFSPKTYRIGAF